MSRSDIQGGRLFHGAQRHSRVSLDGEVQRRGAFKEGQALVKGYLWGSRLGLAAVHPLQDDDEAFDQLFEVEDPVLMKSCADMRTCSGDTETVTWS